MVDNQNKIKNENNLFVVNPTKNDNFNIPYILYVPTEMEEGATLVVETNRIDTISSKEMIEEGLAIVTKLHNCLDDFKAPILVPLFPNRINDIELKKLSMDCFDLEKNSPYYRIDEQILSIISKVRRDIRNITNNKIDNRVFMSGIYESGVFVQRFALLYPNIIDTICINGAISTIPIPTKLLKYPFGCNEIKTIIGKDMDLISYFKIKHSYSEYSFENDIKLIIESDKEKFISSSYDMFYLEKGMDKKTYYRYKNYGIDMFERATIINNQLNSLGIDIKLQILDSVKKENVDKNPILINEIYNTYSKMYSEKGKKRIKI